MSLPLFAAAYLALYTPAIARAGWIGALPSLALAYRADVAAEQGRRALAGWATPMGRELAAREAASGLDLWTRRVLIRRYMEANKREWDRLLQVRSPAPTGEPIFVSIIPSLVMGMRRGAELIVFDSAEPSRRAGGTLVPSVPGKWVSRLEMPPLPPGQHELNIGLELRHGARWVWRGQRTLSVEIATPEESPVTFDKSPLFAAALESHAAARLVPTGPGKPPQLQMRTLQTIPERDGMHVVLRIELLRGAEVVATGLYRPGAPERAAQLARRSPEQPPPPAGLAAFDLEWLAPAEPLDAAWTLRVTGDRKEALATRPGPATIWIGQVILPVEVDREGVPVLLHVPGARRSPAQETGGD